MVIEAARKLVDRSSFAALKTDEDRVASLYLAIYQRPPTKNEITLGLRYVRANPTGTAGNSQEPRRCLPKGSVLDLFFGFYLRLHGDEFFVLARR